MARKIISLCLNLGVVLTLILALFFLRLSGQMLTAASFGYFTILSNIFSAAVSLMFVLTDIPGLILGKDLRKPWMYTLKYITTVSMAVTLFVFALLLAGSMGRDYLSSGANILVHYITPLLTLLDFILWEQDAIEDPRLAASLAFLAPVIYLTFCLVASFAGADFGGGARVPYFFLDYENLGWFSLNGGMPGVIYWILALMAAVLALSRGLIALKEPSVRRRCAPDSPPMGKVKK